MWVYCDAQDQLADENEFTDGSCLIIKNKWNKHTDTY